jgi:large conductance mechanosensitive channel
VWGREHAGTLPTSPDAVRGTEEDTVIKEFREFITRGNVVDLAVAVVIGAAFTGVVNSFANDVLMQVVAAVFGTPDFGALSIQVRDAEIFYGAFLNALVNFLIVAFAMFLVIKAINRLQRLRPRPEEEAAAAAATEVELLTEIRDALVGRER